MALEKSMLDIRIQMEAIITQRAMMVSHDAHNDQPYTTESYQNVETQFLVLMNELRSLQW